MTSVVVAFKLTVALLAIVIGAIHTWHRKIPVTPEDSVRCFITAGYHFHHGDTRICSPVKDDFVA